MIKEFTFNFNDLVVSRPAMEAVLGFTDGCPEPFHSYLDEALRFAENLPDIRAAYRIMDGIEMDGKRTSLLAGGVEFHVGRMIKREIRNSSRIAFFICTAGEMISARSKKLLAGDDPVLGYLYDVAGSFIAEAAGDRMQQMLAEELEPAGEKMTNRYSPGYCQWPVSGQQALFSLFEGKTCGVTLTPSSLMLPVKSISGLIGIGSGVNYREYQCELCKMKNCTYRKVRGGVYLGNNLSNV
ncbi:MAG: vitamin B12 dependent-methionine synthase activation domain-containing protein [Mangrovibacterium sp.]